MTSQLIQQNILKTLCFFSIFSRPLRKEEIFLYLYSQEPIGQKAIDFNLSQLVQTKKISKLGNYYALKVDKGVFHRYKKLSEKARKNWQKVQRIGKLLQLIPFTKSVAVINNLSFGIATSISDIDLLVITKTGRLYICRTLIVLFLKLLGIYKTRRDRAGKFCLGFYLAADNLDIHQIALKPQDPYYNFWLVNLTPVWELDLYQKFLEKNLWIKKYFANFNYQRKIHLNSHQIIKINKFSSVIQAIGEIFFISFIGDFIEQQMAKFHISHTWNLAENRSRSATTIAKNNILKLHANDRRRHYNKQFFRCCKKLS